MLLEDILTSLTRPGLDPRDNLPPPVFRRGIMKLEDLQAGMELQGTVLNVVDFGVFVDIGLSDSGLVHISRLADRFIRDPHEVVGVGDVLKVWVVDVDKTRRRVSLTAIAPGTSVPAPAARRAAAAGAAAPRSRGRKGTGVRKASRGGQPAQQGAGTAAPSGQQTSRPPHSRRSRPHGDRPPRHGGGGGGRRDQRGGNREQYPKTVERPPTKPKVVKPLTKAMEEGKAPMRSFSDLKQLMEKKKEKDTPPPPPPPSPEGEAPPPSEAEVDIAELLSWTQASFDWRMHLCLHCDLGTLARSAGWPASGCFSAPAGASSRC